MGALYTTVGLSVALLTHGAPHIPNKQMQMGVSIGILVVTLLCYLNIKSTYIWKTGVPLANSFSRPLKMCAQACVLSHGMLCVSNAVVYRRGLDVRRSFATMVHMTASCQRWGADVVDSFLHDPDHGWPGNYICKILQTCKTKQV